MDEIFLSYRRRDSQNATGRIHDHLEVYFGKDSVFRDIDGIPAGSHFPDVLERAIDKCKIVVAVIGAEWLTVTDDAGRKRLEDPQDYVRQEIAMALEKKTVIPVLVSHAAMPTRGQLPDAIKGLGDHNAVYAPPNNEFRRSIRSLARQIASVANLPFEDFWETLDQCQEAGLTVIKEDFRRDETSLDEIEHAKDLLVIQNDGRSWIDQNRERILGRLEDPGKRTRIVLYHPQSKFLSTLIEKNKKELSRQKAEIKASYDLLFSAAARPGKIELHGHHGFNPYSLLISERYAFLSPYHYMEAGKLPILKFSSRGRRPIYRALREDAIKLFDAAIPLEQKHFVDDLLTGR